MVSSMPPPSPPSPPAHPAAPRARSLTALLRAAAVASVCASACAFTGPPHPAPAAVPAEPDCPPPTLVLDEGQPRGLLLSVGWPADVAALCEGAASVTLLRAEKSATGVETSWASHYVFATDAQETRFLDQGLTPGSTYRYVLVLADHDQHVLSASSHVELTWRAPAEPPGAVDATAVGRHVYLEWTPEATSGALVFRRHLGHGGFVRASEILPPGTTAFVDTAAEPGEIYTYVVSAVVFEGVTPLVGPPGPEVYVEATLLDPPAQPTEDESPP